MTISEYVSLFHAYMLAGKADDSLDAIHAGLPGFTEHYHVAPRWGEDAVCQAVHQKVLPMGQARLHAIALYDETCRREQARGLVHTGKTEEPMQQPLCPPVLVMLPLGSHWSLGRR